MDKAAQIEGNAAQNASMTSLSVAAEAHLAQADMADDELAEIAEWIGSREERSAAFGLAIRKLISLLACPSKDMQFKAARAICEIVGRPYRGMEDKDVVKMAKNVLNDELHHGSPRDRQTAAKALLEDARQAGVNAVQVNFAVELKDII